MSAEERTHLVREVRVAAASLAEQGLAVGLGRGEELVEDLADPTPPGRIEGVFHAHYDTGAPFVIERFAPRPTVSMRQLSVRFRRTWSSVLRTPRTTSPERAIGGAVHRSFILSIALLLGSAAARAVPPTVVVPAVPTNGEWGPIPIPLALLGIDPASVTVSGALRGTVEYDGSELLYLPDRSRFTLTDFDLLWIGIPGVGPVLNVAVVRAESDIPRELVAHAGETAIADLGWDVDGTAEWDPASGSYVVAGKGELAFDFMRDDVTARTFGTAAHGAQSGSGSSVTLRPPPPGAPFTVPTSMLVYQGGNEGDLWELWLDPAEDHYVLEAVLTSATGNVARTPVTVPAGPEIGIDLASYAGEVVLRLTALGGETFNELNLPLGFGFDRTWHRFGNLSGRDEENVIELDDLRVARGSIDLARQVVVVDDFDAPEWAEEWTPPTAGALKVETTGVKTSVRDGDGELIASLDQAAVVGPDYLARNLDVPRVAMTCRIDLDLSSLVGQEDSGGATVLAFRDESQPDPVARNQALLQVRRQGRERQVRLVGPGAHQVETTPWIPLAEGTATLEVQWQKTAADQSRLDLWIDGCGTPLQPCASGWELTGIEQTGLVTAVRLGILASTASVKGEVRFDDVACAGDSWVEPE